MYKNEIEFLNGVERDDPSNKNRKPLDIDNVSKIQKEYPGIPSQYIAYLQEVGGGSFRECQFTVWGFLDDGSDLLGSKVKDGIIFFGDNFSGDLSGFDINSGYRIVEYWHDSGDIDYQEEDFMTYIRAKMLMGNNGEDLRE